MIKKIVYGSLALALVLSLSACAPRFLQRTAEDNIMEKLSESIPAQKPAASQPNPAAGRTLTVYGQGSVTLAPDIAYLTVGVHSENKDVNEAVSENSATTKTVRDALIKMGVQEADIQTQNFSIFQQQKYDPSGTPGETYFAVDNALSLKVRDLTTIGKLLGEASRAGANNVYGIQFDLADKSQALSDARKQALENAQKQATEMATALGVSLGDVQTVQVNVNTGGGPLYGGMGGKEMTVASPANVPISAGQIVISADIQIAYEIK